MLLGRLLGHLLDLLPDDLLVHLLDPEHKGPFDLMVQVCFFGQVFGSLGLQNAAIYLIGREETGTRRTTCRPR